MASVESILIFFILIWMDHTFFFINTLNIVHYTPEFIFILARDDFLESCLFLKERHAKVNISDSVCAPNSAHSK